MMSHRKLSAAKVVIFFLGGGGELFIAKRLANGLIKLFSGAPFKWRLGLRACVLFASP